MTWKTPSSTTSLISNVMHASLSRHTPCAYFSMKKYPPVLLITAMLGFAACSGSGDDRPIPGTLEATSTKNNANINNTPRNNPTPNPDPESQPPDQITQRTIIEQQ
jgi:hypothetical protein